jgi:hypothetical protein
LFPPLCFTLLLPTPSHFGLLLPTPYVTLCLAIAYSILPTWPYYYLLCP